MRKSHVKEPYLVTNLTNYVSFLITPMLDALSVSILRKKSQRISIHREKDRNESIHNTKETNDATQTTLFPIILRIHRTNILPNRFIIHIATNKIAVTSQ